MFWLWEPQRLRGFSVTETSGSFRPIIRTLIIHKQDRSGHPVGRVSRRVSRDHERCHSSRPGVEFIVGASVIVVPEITITSACQPCKQHR